MGAIRDAAIRCWEHERVNCPKCPSCLDHTIDACAGPLVVLCDHHHGARMANLERIARDQGAADEQARIVALIREHATTEFMAGREPNARLYRDLVATIKKDG